MRSQALYIIIVFALITGLGEAPTQDVFFSVSGTTTLPTVGTVDD